MPRNQTTSIPRPARAAADAKRSRLGDYTRPIPVEKRLWRRPRVALIVGTFALAVLGTLAAAVFILPLGTWRDQSDTIERKSAQLAELERVNAQVEAEVARLRTDDGVREAAREDYNFVEVGEERTSILPFPPLPTTFPAGYPYNVVTDIISAVAAGPRPAEAPPQP